jgi:hypothetical protein
VKTINEISQAYGVHPTQVGLWKKEILDRAKTLFEGKRGPKAVATHQEPDLLCFAITCLIANAKIIAGPTARYKSKFVKKCTYPIDRQKAKANAAMFWAILNLTGFGCVTKPDAFSQITEMTNIRPIAIR